MRKDGKVMHFDILVPSDLTNNDVIFGYGRSYLKSKPFQIVELTSKECRFCHIEEASPKVKEGIETQGYFIIEMENCT